jgi:hypothetical protein
MRILGELGHESVQISADCITEVLNTTFHFIYSVLIPFDNTQCALLEELGQGFESLHLHSPQKDYTIPIDYTQCALLGELGQGLESLHLHSPQKDYSTN